jgi:hypothetical protein
MFTKTIKNDYSTKNYVDDAINEANFNNANSEPPKLSKHSKTSEVAEVLKKYFYVNDI